MRQAWVLMAAALLAGAAHAQAPEAPLEELEPVWRMTPQYPREALHRNIGGFVEIEVTITPQGMVRAARVVHSRPPGVFDASALQAVKMWKFRPKVVDGRAVEATGIQRITYALEQPDSRVAACERARQPRRADAEVSESFARALDPATRRISVRDYAKAEPLAREALGTARSPFEVALAQQVLGGALAGLQRDDEAIAAYEAALKTQGLPWPSHDQAQFKVAQLHAIAGRNEQARQVLETYLKESCAPSQEARELHARLVAVMPANPPPADSPR